MDVVLAIAAGAIHIAFLCFAFECFALVEGFLTFGECHLYFDAAIFPVKVYGDCGEAFLGDGAAEFVEFFTG